MLSARLPVLLRLNFSQAHTALLGWDTTLPAEPHAALRQTKQCYRQQIYAFLGAESSLLARRGS